MIDAVYEIHMKAPKGFRPSDWVARLMNFDECAELEADLVYPRFTPDGEVLAVRAELLDPAHPNHRTRTSIFSQLMKFAKDNGHALTIDTRLAKDDVRVFERTARALDERGLAYTLRAQSSSTSKR